MEEWGIEVSKSEGSRTPQKRPTEATNLEPLGLTEPGSIRSWTWIPYTSVANAQLVGPLTSRAGVVSDSVPCCWIPFPLPKLSGWASVGEDVPSPAGTRYPRVGWYPRGGALLSLRRRGVGESGRDL